MRITVVGTGRMGFPMAERLLEAGHEVTAYNRDISKAESLRSAGARVIGSLHEAVGYGECILIMLTDFGAINQTLSSLTDEAWSGRSVIQMGTILPRESRELGGRIEQAGGAYCECPVLGSRGEVAAGRLILMFGGTAAQAERFRPVLTAFGKDFFHVGPVGSAAAVKLALNQLIVSLSAAFSLSLGMVRENGIDVDRFMEILRASVLYAETFDKKLPRMLSRDFTDPNFPVQHMMKDVRLVVTEARERGLAVDMVEAIAGQLRAAAEQGWQGEDYSAIYKIIHPVSQADHER